MSGLSGDKRLRRTLRRVEPATNNKVAAAIEDTAERIESAAIAFAPVDEGDLVRSIARKKGRDGLTYVIGPGAKSVRISKSPFAEAAVGVKGATKRDRLMQFFKGFWIEFGTRKMRARPFMQPAFDMNRNRGVREVQRAIKQALEEASR